MKSQNITLFAVFILSVAAVPSPKKPPPPPPGLLAAGELCDNNRGQCDGNGNCDDIGGKGKKKDPMCENANAAPGPGAGKAEAFSVQNATSSTPPSERKKPSPDLTKLE
ncbi:hypothetical protein HYALB_00003323 [Hymenoscyphus albidus]|uniref:Uncharacterized protein n=1 Tax=Hymenoscyphus albidus TaxID=595503 RepID=A0A9N9PXQ8_9HELO|nr:hypothetical protein HYALB_00003323 [Hymenoscyphus albidus]